MSCRSPIVVFEDVAVSYAAGRPPALAGIDLVVEHGERVALLGLNGSGKTTLLYAAVGLVTFTGSIEIDGAPLGEASVEEARRKTGFLFAVPEDQILFPRVIDDVAFSLRSRGASPAEAREQAERALTAMGAVGIEDRAPATLSHGQRLRVALAGALAAEPSILLLDEPSAGLDPPGRRELAAHLAGLPAAILLATHDLAFARAACDRFILLEEGRIALAGDRFDLIAERWAPGAGHPGATNG